MRRRLAAIVIAASLASAFVARPVFSMSGPPDWPDEDELPATNAPPVAAAAAPQRPGVPGAAPYALVGGVGIAAAAFWLLRRPGPGIRAISASEGEKDGPTDVGPKS